MKLAFKQLQLQGLKRQQHLLLATCGVLVVSNLVLVLSYVNNDQQRILIPQLNPEHRVQLNQASYSDEYLQEWAGDILRDVFTANPASIKGKVKRTVRGMTRKKNWKKAYVTLAAGQDLDYMVTE